MNKCLLFIAGICWVTLGFGQKVQQRTLAIKGEEPLSYAFFRESASPKGVLLGLPDSDPGQWNIESWCRELYPLAEKNEWLLLVPATGKGPAVDQKRVTKLIELYRDSTSGHSVRTVSLGSGDALAVTLVSQGIPGLVISPRTRHHDWPAGAGAETAVAISADIGNTAAPSLYDTLAATGQWVKMAVQDEGKDYYIRDHYLVYDNLLLWADSMHRTLGDSIARDQLTANPGLRNTLPEVLRQGQPLSLDLWIVQPGTYTVQVLDLSANAVYSQQYFFGKGAHAIEVPTAPLNWGVYHIEVTGGGLRERHKFMIRG